MTGLIRMVPDDVRGMAQKVDLTAGELYNKPSTLRSLATSLRSNWEGGKADQYAEKLRQLAGLLHRETINLQRLASQVRNEVAEWEQRDAAQGIIGEIKAYVVTPGEGPLSPTTSGVNYRPIVDIIRGGIKFASYGAKITETSYKLAGGANSVPWLGPVLSVIGGLALFGDLVNTDMEKYSTDKERFAAIIIDALFALTITKLKIGAGVAITYVLVPFLAGLAVSTAGLATPLALLGGLGAWVGVQVIADGVEKWFKGDVHDSIVQYVAQNLDNPAFMANLGMAAIL